MSLEATSDLWWKNAIVYCVDTQSFLDTTGDGVGDIDGLTQRVDYLAGLGVTCLWLMPIYPSPERDYGYDVADYYGVADKYGTLGDVVELVRVARERGIRVIADLVINHTSIDHPWFQMARKGHPIYHDFYVWSDEKPPDADEGVIFPGKQDSIWSYDRSAKRWYMHRFMSFQPDLNINNPAVRDEIHKVIGFWLELGLSGFRIDAVPFLIEQEGLEHEEVTDAHDYLRDIRDFASRRRGDVMLLAEANEPIDILPRYFGDHGEQMHVAFNFVVNQALYLALARGQATPVADALRSLPPIPPECQWATFVRNHDELSLDKLSDEEREEVFAAFAPKQSQRLFDRGIRRRLPTMVGGDRRKIELMYSLCFTLPGTPVLFYGEEIGLGDNPAMAEREAVRLPMQWTAEPGAGFTKAEESKLPRKLLRDGPFGYPNLNVESQQRDRDSLLNWFERAIRVRKEWPEFGWGGTTVLGARNDAVLAHVTIWDGRCVFAVHNFSGEEVRANVQLPKEAAGGRWHQIFGPDEDDAADVPASGRVSVELGPFEYRWFGRREGV
ncbi:MAG TPA: alpha-amylase family protein [Candidatus Limnocylindrales bacterium]|nr:alpha-amylase family protein [Candidatus Limnocylindrales bacterium]